MFAKPFNATRISIKPASASIPKVYELKIGSVPINSRIPPTPPKILFDSRDTAFSSIFGRLFQNKSFFILVSYYPFPRKRDEEQAQPA
jgi:hypothetical protein